MMTTDKIKGIARWCIDTAADKTQSGNYIFNASDIAEALDENEDEVASVMEMIGDEIWATDLDNVLDVQVYKIHGDNETVIDIILGANICCEHCKGVCNRSYEECGDCDVMMDLWEE